jgi:hypothetical protein
MITAKDMIEQASKLGMYLPKGLGYREYADLNGTEARRFLQSLGYEIVQSGDTGGHGFALTKCGVYLSTNGYICRDEVNAGVR